MRHAIAIWILSAASVLASPGRASCDAVVWTFDVKTPSGLVDARDDVALSETEGDWKQLFGSDADSAAPGLYSRTPEARLLQTGAGGRRLCLRVLGGRVLIASGPRRIPELPRFRLRAAADTSALGGGALSAGVRFLASDGATVLEEVTRVFASDLPIELEGRGPIGATFASLSLRMIGSAIDREERVQVGSFTLELLPAIRIARGRDLPFYGVDEEIALDAAAHGLARGPHVLHWKLVRVILPDDATEPACEVGEPLVEGDLTSWAPARRPAIWRLKLPPRSPVGEPRWLPGSYKLALCANEPREGRVLTESFLFAVVSSSPAFPRSLWPKIEARLGSKSALPHYAGALSAVEDDSGVASVHVFIPGEGGAPILVSTSPSSGSKPDYSAERFFAAPP